MADPVDGLPLDIPVVGASPDPFSDPLAPYYVDIPDDTAFDPSTLSFPPGTSLNPTQVLATLAGNEDATYRRYLAAKKYFENTLKTRYDESGGKILRLVQPTTKLDDLAYIAGGGSTSTPGNPVYQNVEPGNELQLLYDQYQEARKARTDFKGDLTDKVFNLVGGGGGDGGGGGGVVDAAKAYRDSEQLKTKEINRQFGDFASRADELYQLYKQEADAAYAVDDQNNQNTESAMRYGTMSPFYVHTPADVSRPLSSILAPSLPSYVRPDYRNNQAVGLPGPQGFDDPDYNANGMPPQYAMGTVASVPDLGGGWIPPWSNRHPAKRKR